MPWTMDKLAKETVNDDDNDDDDTEEAVVVVAVEVPWDDRWWSLFDFRLNVRVR